MVIEIIPYDEHERVPGCEHYHEAIGDVASAYFRQDFGHERIDYRYPLVFWRKKRGFTQAALAELVGISQSYLAQVELKRRVGDVNLYARLALELNVSLEDIVNEPTVPTGVGSLDDSTLINRTRELSVILREYEIEYRSRYDLAINFGNTAFDFGREASEKRFKESTSISNEFAIRFIYRYLPKVLSLEAELCRRLGQEIVNNNARSSVLRNRGVAGNLDFLVLSRYLSSLADKLAAKLDFGC